MTRYTKRHFSSVRQSEVEGETIEAFAASLWVERIGPAWWLQNAPVESLLFLPDLLAHLGREAAADVSVSGDSEADESTPQQNLKTLATPLLDAVLDLYETTYGRSLVSTLASRRWSDTPSKGRGDLRPSWYARLRAALGQHVTFDLAMRSRYASVGWVFGGGDLTGVGRSLEVPTLAMMKELKAWAATRSDRMTELEGGGKLSSPAALFAAKLVQADGNVFGFTNPRHSVAIGQALGMSIWKLAGAHRVDGVSKASLMELALDIWFETTMAHLADCKMSTERDGLASAALARALIELPKDARRAFLDRYHALFEGSEAYKGAVPRLDSKARALVSDLRLEAGTGEEDADTGEEDTDTGEEDSDTGEDSPDTALSDLQQLRAIAEFALDSVHGKTLPSESVFGDSMKVVAGHYVDDVEEVVKAVAKIARSVTANNEAPAKDDEDRHNRFLRAESIQLALLSLCKDYVANAGVVVSYANGLYRRLAAATGAPLVRPPSEKDGISVEEIREVASMVIRSHEGDSAVDVRLRRLADVFAALPQAYRSALLVPAVGDDTYEFNKGGFERVNDYLDTFSEPGAAHVRRYLELLDEVNTEWGSDATTKFITVPQPRMWATATSGVRDDLIELQAWQAYLGAHESDADTRYAKVLGAVFGAPEADRAALVKTGIFSKVEDRVAPGSSYLGDDLAAFTKLITAIKAGTVGDALEPILDAVDSRLSCRKAILGTPVNPYEPGELSTGLLLDRTIVYRATWAALLEQRFAGVSGRMGTVELDFQGVMRACAAHRELSRRGLREDPPYDWSVTMSGGLSFAQACQVHDKLVALIDVSWHGFAGTHELLLAVYGQPSRETASAYLEFPYMMSRAARIAWERGGVSATVVDPFFSAGPGLDEALRSFEVWRERMLWSPGLLEHEPHLRAVHASFGALGRRGLDWDDARRSTADGASQVAGTIAATAVLAATGGLGAPLVPLALSVGAAAGAAAWGSVLGRVAVEGLTEVDLPEAAYDYARGGFEGALEGLTGGLLHGLGGAAKAGPALNLLDEGVEATITLNKVMRATVDVTEAAGRAAFEGMAEGVVGGLGGAVFETAMDRHTWSQSVYETFSAFLWRATVMSALGLGGGAVGGLVGGLAFGVARAAGRTTPTSGDVWDAYEIALAAKKSGTDHILYQASPEQHAAVVEGLQRMQKARRQAEKATDPAAKAKADADLEKARIEVEKELRGAAFTEADTLAMMTRLFDAVETHGLKRAAREFKSMTEMFSELVDKDLSEVFEGVEVTELAVGTSLQSQVPSGITLRDDARSFLKVTEGSGSALDIEVIVDAEAGSTVLRREFLHALDLKYGRLAGDARTRTLWKELTWEELSGWAGYTWSEKRAALYAKAVLEKRNAEFMILEYGARPRADLTVEQGIALEDARMRLGDHERLEAELDALNGKTEAEIRSGMEALGISGDVPLLGASTISVWDILEDKLADHPDLFARCSELADHGSIDGGTEWVLDVFSERAAEAIDRTKESLIWQAVLDELPAGSRIKVDADAAARAHALATSTRLLKNPDVFVVDASGGVYRCVEVFAFRPHVSGVDALKETVRHAYRKREGVPVGASLEGALVADFRHGPVTLKGGRVRMTLGDGRYWDKRGSFVKDGDMVDDLLNVMNNTRELQAESEALDKIMMVSLYGEVQFALEKRAGTWVRTE